MTLPTYYATGTASVNNGATAVTGTGTGWGTDSFGTPVIEAGDFFMDPAQPEIPPQRIASVTDATHMVLARPWPGANVSGAYEVQFVGDIVRSTAQTRRVLSALDQRGLPQGGSPGQVLAKTTGDDFAADWVDDEGAANAADVAFIPAGSIEASNVQDAIEELDSATASAIGAIIAGTRPRLAANRTLYVGHSLGAVSISIASPGVVTKVGHGLTANSRVSFSILQNTKPATISVASPAVVTMANSFAAGQPVKFESTGRLPTGITSGTTYYVIATGLSGAGFQISATPGGAAVNTSAPAVTISNASPGVVTLTAHGLVFGTPVRFATTGALPAGLTAGTTYFVKTVPTADTFTVSTTPEGAAINTSSAGSGTHTLVQFGAHYASETGALPTGVTAGQDYYVLATGLSADAFRFSATSGGAAINTSGSTSGAIAAKTGSDSNDGSADSTGGALLTIAKALELLLAVDLGGQYVGTAQLADGTYPAGVTVGVGVGIASPANLVVQGNSSYPSNVVVDPSGNCFYGRAPGAMALIKDLTMKNDANGAYALRADAGAVLHFANVVFAGNKTDMLSYIGGTLVAAGGYMIRVSAGGSKGAHVLVAGGQVDINEIAPAVAIIGFPTITNFAIAQRNGLIETAAAVFSGATLGMRYLATTGGGVMTANGGASFLPGSIAGSATSPGWYA